MTAAEGVAGASGVEIATTASIRTWALVALVLYIVSGVAFAGFTAAGGIWYTISDAVGLLLSVALMVLVLRFDDLFRPLVRSISRTARWTGVVGMALAIAGSIVLLTSDVSHEFIPGEGGLGMQFAGWGLLGVWFVLLGVMASRTGMFSGRWIKAAQVAGWGSVMAMALTLPLGPGSPVVSVGFTVTFIAIVFWVVWTRRELQQR